MEDSSRPIPRSYANITTVVGIIIIIVIIYDDKKNKTRVMFSATPRDRCFDGIRYLHNIIIGVPTRYVCIFKTLATNKSSLLMVDGGG